MELSSEDRGRAVKIGEEIIDCVRKMELELLETRDRNALLYGLVHVLQTVIIQMAPPKSWDAVATALDMQLRKEFAMERLKRTVPSGTA